MTVAGRPRIALVPGEEELGPQRRCSRCGEHWPLDPDFWGRSRTGALGLQTICRACSAERAQQARRSGRWVGRCA